jgi:hypothetical protein
MVPPWPSIVVSPWSLLLVLALSHGPGPSRLWLCFMDLDLGLTSLDILLFLDLLVASILFAVVLSMCTYYLFD